MPYETVNAHGGAERTMIDVNEASRRKTKDEGGRESKEESGEDRTTRNRRHHP